MTIWSNEKFYKAIIFAQVYLIKRNLTPQKTKPTTASKIEDKLHVMFFSLHKNVD